MDTSSALAGMLTKPLSLLVFSYILGYNNCNNYIASSNTTSHQDVATPASSDFQRAYEITRTSGLTAFTVKALPRSSFQSLSPL